MNKNILILFLFLITTGFRPGYKKYCNARFNFCISYPSDFTKLPESENGDGRIFISKDKKAEIRMYGSLAVEEYETLIQHFAIQSSGLRLSFKSIKVSSYIFSGTGEDGKIIYQKTVKRGIEYMGSKNTDVFQTLRISYPPDQKKKYESYCAVIAKSL
jgi:hypothetical protein